ncbi:hypothetical protein [Streptomyces lavendulae]|uniref:hypothetical protein n=1 Tax=Streptomyces lavendulae TaxID=1914 RepID=UPI003678780C
MIEKASRKNIEVTAAPGEDAPVESSSEKEADAGQQDTAATSRAGGREVFRLPDDESSAGPDTIAKDGIYSATFIPPLDSTSRTAGATAAAGAGPYATDLGALQGSEDGSASASLPSMAGTEIAPEDLGKLSLRHVDGVPQLVLSSGTAIPAALTVVTESGETIASHHAGTPIAPRSQPMLNVCIVGHVNPGK